MLQRNVTSSMITLRSCGIFNRIFTKMFIACDMRFAEQSHFVSKCRGYVHHIHNSTYCTISEKKGRLSTHNFARNKNDSSNDDNINNKSVVPMELQSCLELMNTGYNDMRVDYNVLLDALRIYAKLSDPIEDTIDIFLLNCCGQVLPDITRESRQNLTNHVWKLLKRKNPNMSLDYYHTYLNICAQNCMKIEPEEFINSMNIGPNIDTYRSLLNVAVKAGDSYSIQFTLLKMKVLKYSLNHETFCALIEMYGRNGYMNSVDSLIETAVPFEIDQQNEFWGSLACGYARQNDIENVLKLLESHSINNEHLLLIIKTLSLLDNGKDIKEILGYLSINNIVTNPLLYNIVVELVHSKKLDDASSIMKFFHDNCQSNSTIHLAKHFLKAIVRAKVPENIILEFANEYSKIHPSNTILHLLLEESLRSAYKNLSLLMLVEMKNKNIDIRPHYYWPLLIQARENAGEPGVFEIVKYMTELNVNIDHDTLLDYILPHISTIQPMDTLRKLTDHGIPLSSVITSLTCYLLEKGQIEKTLSLCPKVSYKVLKFDKLLPSLVRAYKITHNAHACTKLLQFSGKHTNYNAKFLLELCDSELFENDIAAVLKTFINTYKKCELFISDCDAGLIMNKLSLACSHSNEIIEPSALSLIVGKSSEPIDYFAINSLVIHPHDMNEEQLENHFIELESKELKTRGVLRKLIMIHCKGNNIKRVEELMERIVKRNIAISAGMKSCLLEFYARNSQVSELCEILLDLRNNHPQFKIDASKILLSATTLVKENQLEMALSIINNANTTFKFTRGCWKLLDAIARSERADLTASILDLLIKNGYCDISTSVLGPLVRQHLLKNDIATAVDTFKMVAMKHKKTPLRQELVSILIENLNKNISDNNEAKSMLQNVLKLIIEIHGEETSRMDVIIGYAQCEMLAELQIALQNFDSFQAPIEQSIAVMTDELKLKVLTTILNASHGNANVDRNLIYTLILTIYCKMGNCEEAINLWRRQRNEQMRPSKVFNENLLNLLSMHKKKIPLDLKTYTG